MDHSEGKLKTLEQDFAVVHSALRQIEKDYNPSGENLHFASLIKADTQLYERVLALAREGLTIVRKHREYFSKHALYDDGMFWYDLFLTISAAACKVKHDGIQAAIPQNVVKELTLVLVDISEFSTVHGGDITKRNHEALGNTLWAFNDKALIRGVRARNRKIGQEQVKEFIN